MPHGYCLGWPGPPAFPPWLVVAHMAGDLGGVLPYALLSLGVSWWLRRSWGLLPRRWRAIGVSTTAFLALCGLCHAMDILTLIWPLYYPQAVVKVAMGVAASCALGLSWQEIPRLRQAQWRVYVKCLSDELRGMPHP